MCMCTKVNNIHHYNREKPIEQCITYISQRRQSKLAFRTPQLDSKLPSSSDTKQATPTDSQPVIESKFICQQPPHGSHASTSIGLQSGEAADISTTVQLQADNYSKNTTSIVFNKRKPN